MTMQNMKLRKATLAAIAAIGFGAIAFGYQAVASPSLHESSNSDDLVNAAKKSANVQMAQASGSATTGETASTLPGGASSLQENYQDWLVVCVQQKQDAAAAPSASNRCAASQQQADANSRQRVLAIELAKSEEGLAGMLLMPFGLALDAGVSLQIDDSEAGEQLRVRTCLPAGCLVSLDFDKAKVEALKNASAIKVKAQADGGGERTFNISLKGFGAAAQRLDALNK